MQIWRHYPGYTEAINQVRQQSLQADLSLIDNLFGRENLTYGATDVEVKAEALRQLEIEWRSERDELSELFVLMHRSRQIQH
jgi:hypothetical protein